MVIRRQCFKMLSVTCIFVSTSFVWGKGLNCRLSFFFDWLARKKARQVYTVGSVSWLKVVLCGTYSPLGFRFLICKVKD